MKLLAQTLSMTELYGRFDDVALDWTDGVLTKLFRACAHAAQPNRVDDLVAADGSEDDSSSTDSIDNSPARKSPQRSPAIALVDELLDDADVPKLRWIAIDGPVDASWIENLNTVRCARRARVKPARPLCMLGIVLLQLLDDTKKLSLTSGESLPVAPTMSVVFETMDLSCASPATGAPPSRCVVVRVLLPLILVVLVVSRCGMVYMEPDTLSPAALWGAWLPSLPVLVRTSPCIAVLQASRNC